MIYLVADVFAPNTATTNRFLGFAKAFKQLGANFQNISVKPSKELFKIDDNIYGRTKYLWNGKKTGNKYWNLLVYALWQKIICRSELPLKFFFLSLNKDDIVIVTNPQQLSCAMNNNKCGYRIYHERTEHPYVSRRWANDKVHTKYLADCTRVDGLFVISTSLKKTFIELGVPCEKIHIVNMTVDESRFEGIEQQHAEPYIAYCGTVSNSKDGVDSLIRSFEIVVRYNKNIKLYIIGSVPVKEERNGNMELIRKLHLEDRIVLTGMIASEKMPQILKNAKVLVLARPDNLQAKCGFPTKLGEYLLSGNPVVITKTGDIPLFLEDGKSAMLVEPGNEEVIARKILCLLEDQTLASKIGEKGKQIALENFNYITEARKVLKIIN
ncbi:glycosyltransferase family 4 protein [Faecalibacillus intestinalis]|uniref:glycosyltransferase family 4 protein n=1 Tax=Faecalibacillus intestinalis TaxID=1982626 RepID=UPI003AB6638F